jgi:hypothetical protein
MIELYILLSLLFAAWYLADNIIHADDVQSYRILALETFFVLIAWPAIIMIVVAKAIIP